MIMWCLWNETGRIKYDVTIRRASYVTLSSYNILFHVTCFWRAKIIL